jgi:hypothetical protein
MRQTDLRLIMAICAVALVMLLSGPVARADYRALNAKGNKALAEDKTDEALKYYKDAEIEKPKQPVSRSKVCGGDQRLQKKPGDKC